MEDDSYYETPATINYKYSICLKAIEKRRFLWPKHHWLGLDGHWEAPPKCDRLAEKQKIITATLERFGMPSGVNVKVLEFSMTKR